MTQKGIFIDNHLIQFKTHFPLLSDHKELFFMHWQTHAIQTLLLYS